MPEIVEGESFALVAGLVAGLVAFITGLIVHSIRELRGRVEKIERALARARLNGTH